MILKFINAFLSILEIKEESYTTWKLSSTAENFRRKKSRWPERECYFIDGEIIR